MDTLGPPLLTALQSGHTVRMGQLCADLKGLHGQGGDGTGGIHTGITDRALDRSLQLRRITVLSLTDSNASCLDHTLQILIAERAQTTQFLDAVLLIHPDEAAVVGFVYIAETRLGILTIPVGAVVTTMTISRQALHIAIRSRAGGTVRIAARQTSQLIRRFLIIQTRAYQIQTRLRAAIERRHALTLALATLVHAALGIPQAGGVLERVAVDAALVLRRGRCIVAVIGLADGAAGPAGGTVAGQLVIRIDGILAATCNHCATGIEYGHTVLFVVARTALTWQRLLLATGCIRAAETAQRQILPLAMIVVVQLGQIRHIATISAAVDAALGVGLTAEGAAAAAVGDAIA